MAVQVNHPSSVVDQILNFPEKVIGKFEGMKNIMKLAKNVSEFALHTIKNPPEQLEAFHKATKHFSGFLSGFEILLIAPKWFNGEAFQGETLAEKSTKAIAMGAKSIKSILDAAKYVDSFLKNTGPVSTLIGPISHICDICNATFTIINEQLSIQSSKKRVEKYEQKQQWIAQKFQNPMTMTQDMKHVALKRLFGFDSQINRWDEGLRAYQDMRNSNQLTPQRLRRMDASLIGRIDQALANVTMNDLSPKFWQEIQLLNNGQGRYVGLVAPGLNLAALLQSVKNELRSYLLSDQQMPTNPFLIEVIQDNKKIKQFLKDQDRLHYKWRKWENIAKFTLQPNHRCNVNTKRRKITRYVQSKTLDKTAEITSQKNQQKKSWIMTAFAILLLTLAIFALGLFIANTFMIAPVFVLAAPLLIKSLAVVIPVVSLGKLIFTQYAEIKTKKELDTTKWLKII